MIFSKTMPHSNGKDSDRVRPVLDELLAELPAFVRRSYEDLAVYRAGGFDAFVNTVASTALSRRDSFVQTGDLKTDLRKWMSGIARHLHNEAVRDLYKCAVNVEQEVFEAAKSHNDTPSRAVTKEEFLGTFRQWLAGLSDQDRRLLVLKHLEGRTYTQIAAATEMTEDQVDHAFRRIREAAKGFLVSSGTWRMLAGGR
jgi:RNA polymerase sigma factor (sigma-70 family)